MSKSIVLLIHILIFSSTVGAQDSLLHIGKFQSTVALSVDPGGTLYVVDAGTNQILKISRDGKVLAHVGGYGWSEATFDHPSDISTPNGIDIFVADYANHRVQRFDIKLSDVSSFPTEDDREQGLQFRYPRSVAYSRHGSLYVVDGENNQVVRITDNHIENTFGGIDAGKGKLTHPTKVRVSTHDLVYVQDENALLVYDSFGNYINTIGKGLFHDLRTFTVVHQSLYVLDSCTVLAYDEDKKAIRSLLSICEHTNEIGSPIEDIAVYQDTLFLLTKHNITKIGLSPDTKEK